MALDELKENDQTTHVAGLNLLMDDTVKPLAGGHVIDYIDNRSGRGFIITMPYGHNAC